jgi:hypothetical protein
MLLTGDVMTRKDYIKIARVINDNASISDGKRIIRWAFIRELCDVLEEDNPNFNSIRFKEACGLEFSSN